MKNTHNLHKLYKRGFTLIELLVVISIIGMLSSVVLAGLQSAKAKGRTSAGVKFDTYTYRLFGADMKAEWTFDDSTTPGTDSSGNGNNLTSSGGATIVSETNGGFRRNSLNLSASGETYYISNFPIDLWSGSVSVWIKPSSFGSKRIFAGYSNQGGTGGIINLDINASGNIIGENKPNTALTSSNTIFLNEWTHVLYSWSYDNVASNGTQKIYINGKESGSSALSSTWGQTLGSRCFNIGYPNALGTCPGSPSAPSAQFIGQIDEMRFYSKPIQSAQSAEQLFLAGAKAHGIAVNK